MADGLEVLLAIIFQEEIKFRNEEVEAKGSLIAAGREPLLPDVANAHAIQRKGYESLTRGFSADGAALSPEMMVWRLRKCSVIRADNLDGPIRCLV